MKKFEPTFKDLQRDIERYLVSIGKCEKRKDGSVVFRRYDDALKKMFGIYLENNALGPLVKEFKRWNWERSYNDYLHKLTEALKKEKDWENLRTLWEKGVLQKRKKVFNDMMKINKNGPGTIPNKSFEEAKSLLMESISDITKLAKKLGIDDEVERYSKMKSKVVENKQA